MKAFDLIVIGGGPGGYEAAALAGKNGLKVALIEKGELGGTCLNCGCIPLKGYLYLAHMINTANELQKDSIFADLNEFNINQFNVVKRNQSIVDNLRQGIKYKLKNAGVSIFEGSAYIFSVNDEQIIIAVNDLRLSAKYLIVATGSKENRFPITNEFSKYKIIYSDEMLLLQNVPSQMLIVGAGVVGLEAACYFNAIGCEVTVIDISDEIGGGLDSDISGSFRKILERKGIIIYTRSRVKKFYKEEVLVEIAGKDNYLSPEIVLVAVGRTPFVEGIGLKECGIHYDNSGVIIDNACRTNKSNVFACGDVTGKAMLAHTAYEQARIAVDNLLGNESCINYTIIPKIIYTCPEVMTIGLSEKECIINNIQYIVKELPLTYSGKYFVEHKKDGAKAKIIVDVSTRIIIGFSMIGDGASEIALAVEMLMINKVKIADIAQIVFPHPTIGEILRELAIAVSDDIGTEVPSF